MKSEYKERTVFTVLNLAPLLKSLIANQMTAQSCCVVKTVRNIAERAQKSNKTIANMCLIAIVKYSTRQYNNYRGIWVYSRGKLI